MYIPGMASQIYSTPYVLIENGAGKTKNAQASLDLCLVRIQMAHFRMERIAALT